MSDFFQWVRDNAAVVAAVSLVVSIVGFGLTSIKAWKIATGSTNKRRSDPSATPSGLMGVSAALVHASPAFERKQGLFGALLDSFSSSIARRVKDQVIDEELLRINDLYQFFSTHDAEGSAQSTGKLSREEGVLSSIRDQYLTSTLRRERYIGRLSKVDIVELHLTAGSKRIRATSIRNLKGRKRLALRNVKKKAAKEKAATG